MLLAGVEGNILKNFEFIGRNAKVAEFWVMPPYFPSWRTPDMKGDLDRIRDVLTVFDLETTIHAPHHDINLASLNPAVSATALKEVEKSLEVADILGAKTVTFHPGGFRRFRELGLKSLKRSLTALDDKAKEYGTALCLENMMGDNMYCTGSEEIILILQGLENVHVTLDLAHALSQPEDIGDYVRRLGSRIMHAHISDFRGGLHRHLPIGEGELDYKAVLSALKEAGYGGHFIIEGAPENPYVTAPKEIAILKAMLCDSGLA